MKALERMAHRLTPGQPLAQRRVGGIAPPQHRLSWPTVGRQMRARVYGARLLPHIGGNEQPQVRRDMTSSIV